MRKSAADTISKETEYSGLPKMCRSMMVAFGNYGLTPGVPAAIPCDTTLFNYGPYVPWYSAGIRYGWIVQEPGIYRLASTLVFNNGGGLGGQMEFLINGAAPSGYPRSTWPDGPYAPSHMASGDYEMKAGDFTYLQLVSPSAYTLLAGFCTLSVLKLGGRY